MDDAIASSPEFIAASIAALDSDGPHDPAILGSRRGSCFLYILVLIQQSRFQEKSRVQLIPRDIAFDRSEVRRHFGAGVVSALTRDTSTGNAVFALGFETLLRDLQTPVGMMGQPHRAGRWSRVERKLD